MSATNRQRLAKGMRWTARLIALGIMAFFFLALCISLMFRDLGGSDILSLVSLGLALVGWIVSWWREWLAGILLVLASFALSNSSGLGVALPYLVAGVLFLLSWRLSRKAGSSVAPPTLKL